jgi:hypothetical protein
MKNTIIQLRNIIENYGEKLKHLNEEEFSFKPRPDKWNKKEELGHLVDSAHSNLRRFIVAQYETNPKITYQQDAWVRLLDYSDQNTPDLIHLWILLNKQICYALENMPAEACERMCDTGKDQPQLRSLSWLAEDYVKHLLHHLHHILELEAVAY